MCRTAAVSLSKALKGRTFPSDLPINYLRGRAARASVGGAAAPREHSSSMTPAHPHKYYG